jgi:hypothetical protein
VIDVKFGWYTPRDLIEYLSFLKEKGIDKVLVVGDYIELSVDLPNLINTDGFKCEVISQYIQKKDPDYYKNLKNYVEQNQYYFVDVESVFVKQNVCPFWNDQREIFSWDNQHLSQVFQDRLLDLDLPKVKKYLEDK